MRILLEAPFQVSEPMQQLIEEKVNKLTTYYDRITTAKVYLKDKIQRNNRKDERSVEIRLEVPGTTLFAEDAADSFEKALASTTEKVARQLKKYKDQLSTH